MEKRKQRMKGKTLTRSFSFPIAIRKKYVIIPHSPTTKRKEEEKEPKDTRRREGEEEEAV